MKEKKKKRPFDTVRVTSIARKINLNYMGRLFMTYITTDVLVFVLLVWHNCSQGFLSWVWICRWQGTFPFVIRENFRIR